MTNPYERLRYHVTGAIERGEKQPIKHRTMLHETIDALEIVLGLAANTVYPLNTRQEHAMTMVAELIDDLKERA